MPFYYTVVASLSVRTMIMLLRRSGGRMPIAELREEFVSRRLLGERLVTMATNGFLVARSDVYALSPKGRSVAMAFSALKRLWRLGAGG
jgi:predicted transcriptional regulator